MDQGKAVCAYSGKLPDWQFRYWTFLQAAGPRYIRTKKAPASGKQVPYVLTNLADNVFALERNVEVVAKKRTDGDAGGSEEVQKYPTGLTVLKNQFFGARGRYFTAAAQVPGGQIRESFQMIPRQG